MNRKIIKIFNSFFCTAVCVALLCPLLCNVSAHAEETITSVTQDSTATTITTTEEKKESFVLSTDGKVLRMDNIWDLSRVKECKNLNELYVSNAILDDLTPLKDTNITEITFENCALNDFKNIRKIDSLKKLVLTNSLPTDFSPLKKCKNLVSLELHDMNFDNLECISMLTDLEEFIIVRATIQSYKGIENLTKLRLLGFSGVGIQNIDFVSYFPNLRMLYLMYTYVTDISKLAGTGIETLDVSNSSKIKSFDVITTMPNLRKFVAQNCEMTVDSKVLKYIEEKGINSNISKTDLEYQSQVKKITDSIYTIYMTDEDKVYAATNYVVDHIEYDTRADIDSALTTMYNEEGFHYAFLGKGICQNYVVLLNALLQQAEIDCYEIIGKAQGGNHIWLLIDLYGTYFYNDPTWIKGQALDDIKTSIYYMRGVNSNFAIDHAFFTFPETLYHLVGDVDPNAENGSFSLNPADIGSASDLFNLLRTNRNYQIVAICALVVLIEVIFVVIMLSTSKNKKKRKVATVHGNLVDGKNIATIQAHDEELMPGKRDSGTGVDKHLDTETQYYVDDKNNK